jgi:phytoene synthase
VDQSDALVESLPVLQRLALAYAPGTARLPTLALFGLDARLAAVVRSAREPLLAQLSLAWWRDQLAGESAAWPRGEPLLAALRSWAGEHRALAALVDGWEELTGEAPLPASAFTNFAAARGAGFAALARALQSPADAAEAHRLGREWALADVAGRLSDPEEQRTVGDLLHSQDWRAARLSRKLRPLVVLHGLARRAVRKGEGLDRLPPAASLVAMRLGLMGR